MQFVSISPIVRIILLYSLNREHQHCKQFNDQRFVVSEAIRRISQSAIGGAHFDQATLLVQLFGVIPEAIKSIK